MEAVPGIEFYVIGNFIFASIVLNASCQRVSKNCFQTRPIKLFDVKQT